jgi:hypothetical protein
LNSCIKLQKLRKLGWTLLELLRDRQEFTNIFDTYFTRFGNTNHKDAEDDNSDNELALYKIVNPVVLSLLKLCGSEIERYLSEPLLKKSDKKSYAEFWQRCIYVLSNPWLYIKRLQYYISN